MKFQTLCSEEVYTANSLHPGALKVSSLKREGWDKLSNRVERLRLLGEC
jgi:hypothetical protein